jgi:hydrogenase-4 component F
MRDGGVLLWLLLFLPLVGVAVCLVLKSPRKILLTTCGGIFAIGAVAAIAIAIVIIRGTPILAANDWLLLDALSAYHLLVMILTFALTTLFAVRYFGDELRVNHFPTSLARQFSSLWFGIVASIMTVLLSNNLGVMWVGIEATTLVASLLISLHGQPLALEASWKYILLGVVGGTFAFIGTLTVGISTYRLPVETSGCLMWTQLMACAKTLNPEALKIAFIFLLTGYGTKVGLAPMHSWLPDAHSQAPAPVSAIFSGFLLNLSLYCIMRYIPLVEVATNHARWSLRIMVAFGIISIMISAAFILVQHDVKRLLAYHSVEHMGIITMGLGIGGLGVLAGLFHTLNHSVCKTLSFFCAGRLGQLYGTHDMEQLSGVARVAPVWGIGLFASILALIGVAPFAIFMSEFQLVKAALDNRAMWALVFFLFGSSAIFVGALRHAMSMTWGDTAADKSYDKANIIDYVLVLFPLGLLLLLGLWIPEFLWNLIQNAALIVGK